MKYRINYSDYDYVHKGGLKAVNAVKRNLKKPFKYVEDNKNYSIGEDFRILMNFGEGFTIPSEEITMPFQIGTGKTKLFDLMNEFIDLVIKPYQNSAKTALYAMDFINTTDFFIGKNEKGKDFLKKYTFDNLSLIFYMDNDLEMRRTKEIFHKFLFDLKMNKMNRSYLHPHDYSYFQNPKWTKKPIFYFFFNHQNKEEHDLYKEYIKRTDKGQISNDLLDLLHGENVNITDAKYVNITDRYRILLKLIISRYGWLTKNSNIDFEFNKSKLVFNFVVAKKLMGELDEETWYSPCVFIESLPKCVPMYIEQYEFFMWKINRIINYFNASKRKIQENLLIRNNMSVFLPESFYQGLNITNFLHYTKCYLPFLHLTENPKLYEEEVVCFIGPLTDDYTFSRLNGILFRRKKFVKNSQDFFEKYTHKQMEVISLLFVSRDIKKLLQYLDGILKLHFQGTGAMLNIKRSLRQLKFSKDYYSFEILIIKKKEPNPSEWLQISLNETKNIIYTFLHDEYEFNPLKNKDNTWVNAGPKPFVSCKSRPIFNSIHDRIDITCLDERYDVEKTEHHQRESMKDGYIYNYILALYNGLRTRYKQKRNEGEVEGEVEYIIQSESKGPNKVPIYPKWCQNQEALLSFFTIENSYFFKSLEKLDRKKKNQELRTDVIKNQELRTDVIKNYKDYKDEHIIYLYDRFYIPNGIFGRLLKADEKDKDKLLDKKNKGLLPIPNPTKCDSLAFNWNNHKDKIEVFDNTTGEKFNIINYFKSKKEIRLGNYLSFLRYKEYKKHERQLTKLFYYHKKATSNYDKFAYTNYETCKEKIDVNGTMLVNQMSNMERDNNDKTTDPADFQISPIYDPFKHLPILELFKNHSTINGLEA